MKFSKAIMAEQDEIFIKKYLLSGIMPCEQRKYYTNLGYSFEGAVERINRAKSYFNDFIKNRNIKLRDCIESGLYQLLQNAIDNPNLALKIYDRLLKITALDTPGAVINDNTIVIEDYLDKV